MRRGEHDVLRHHHAGAAALRARDDDGEALHGHRVGIGAHQCVRIAAAEE